jgi:hypothetical protein
MYIEPIAAMRARMRIIYSIISLLFLRVKKAFAFLMMRVSPIPSRSVYKQTRDSDNHDKGLRALAIIESNHNRYNKGNIYK